MENVTNNKQHKCHYKIDMFPFFSLLLDLKQGSPTSWRLQNYVLNIRNGTNVTDPGGALWVELKSDEHLRQSRTKQRHLMPFHLPSAVMNHDRDLL